jgi:two-component system sensor histidine kinase KdpD
VTAAAALGGVVSGLIASAVSFLALNVFFTRPLHTFVVSKPEDLVALVVFLVVSATVGTLISTALAQRARALSLAEERSRLDAEARDAREQAETNRIRAALFSSVTHDLRTPLASITAAVTSLLADDARFTPEDRHDLLETIHQEADRLNKVVGNLLDLSRMRAGALVPAKAAALVDEVIEGVIARLEPALRYHLLEVSLPDDLPEVPMDIVQIDQVLTNLLENSAKFSPRGARITVAARRQLTAVRVHVADEGRGIPVEDRKRVFEPFVRGEESQGTGLGLSIARAIIEAHGGKIWIEDGLTCGVAVVFELPIGEPV